MPSTADARGKGVSLRIPAIHDVQTDMTLFKSSVMLLIMLMACNVIHVFEA